MNDLPVPEDTKRDQEAMKHAVPYKQMKKVNPLDGLPEWLKNPANYSTVQKALLETMVCGKLHSDPSQSLNCQKCTDNMLTRRKLMEKFGFRSPAQYMAWRKTNEEIKSRMPLDMYNRMVNEQK
jgi:hypothetical protein